jgi:hypothetical protein
VTGPVQLWMEKIGLVTTVADSMVSGDGPTLVTLTRPVATEFNWTVPKLIVAGARERVSFFVGVFVALGPNDESPTHAVSSNNRTKVRKISRKTKREESGFANLSPGEDFILLLGSLRVRRQM